jgi:AcrR family transcriptional regulator
MNIQQKNIILVASRLFEQFGIRSVSIDDVCNELRMSKKTFYTCFPQKEDLVDAVLTFNKHLNYERYFKLLLGRNAIDSLILIISEIKKNAETESQAQSMCYDLEKYYPKVFEKHQTKKREEIRRGFEINLRQGIAEGFYREDLDVELISLFHSVQLNKTFELMRQSSKKYTKKRLTEFFIDLMIHLIANEKGLQYMKEHSASPTEK